MDFINTGYGATDDLGALFKKKKAKPKPAARTAPRIVAPRPAVARPTALVKAAKPTAKVKAPKPKTSLTDILSKGARLVTDGIKAVNNAGLTKQPLPVPSINIPRTVAPAPKAPVRRVVAPKPATSSGLAGVPTWAWLAVGGVALVALMNRGGGSTSSTPVLIPTR